MQKFADYIKRIEIDSLWSGKKHIVWELNPKVNILSGINGVGKSTILNKVVKGLSAGGEFPSHMLKGVKLDVEPEDARWIRYDLIRSLDNNIAATLSEGDSTLRQTLTALSNNMGGSLLDLQLYQLQRKYLDYQVNIGNRTIQLLTSGDPSKITEAQDIAAPRIRFMDFMDELFADTGKKIVRTSNEILFDQFGSTLLPYSLSSGEKQLLVIMLTTLVQDMAPCVLLMDEPEISLHIEWQQQLIQRVRSLNPNVQIIMTTHSPALIMDGWMDNVFDVDDITVK